MPPIQVYTKSPINASKASGVTPQTAAPDEAAANPPPPTTTTSSPYQPPSNNNNPIPTRTTPSLNSGPPPPQPGAVPRLPEATATASSNTTHSNNNTPAPPAPTAAPSGIPIPGVNLPPQMAIPPPPRAFAAGGPHNQRGTSTATTQPMGTGINSGAGYSPAASLGPGGYQQNTAAVSGFVAPAYQGGGGGGGSGGYGDEDEEGFLGSAKKFAKAAGEKLSAAESEVWKRINGEEK
ncbi:hypothetical protein B0J18DRAFT_410338 [Chaetomium sp. MPI-SDFR-AT-0129]|nr:hypothetical protein B0J18DRAFT_410338 [Chaetomium sp. MPI-SDFR-AT-0129]